MGKPLNLLLVEDNESDEMLLLMHLKSEGYEVSHQRVMDAKALKDALKQNWDIVISDFDMPQFNGEDALKIFREHDEFTPFILISGAVGEDVAVLMMRNGCNDYLMKDNLVRLSAVIEREIYDSNIKREQKKIQDEIKVLSLVTRHTSNAIIITDPKGYIEWVNDAFIKISGYSLNEIKGRKPGEFLQGPKTNPETIALMRKSIRLQEPFNCEIINYSKNKKEYWMEIHAEPIYNDKDKVVRFFAIQRDITAKKNYERQLENANIELEEKVKERTEQLNKINKDLEAFNYAVSHDLRSPVLQMLRQTELLLAEKIVNKNRIEDLSRNCRKLNQQINDLLAFSIMGNKVKENTFFSMEALFKEILDELLQKYDTSKIEVSIEALPEAYADKNMMRHVVFNLLSNALKYSSKNGKQLISVKGLTKDDENIYCVSDNGVGFDMANYDQLFFTFKRLHPDSEFEGSGAGLAILERVVARHGGRVWAESEPGKGATFYFSLPRVK